MSQARIHEPAMNVIQSRTLPDETPIICGHRMILQQPQSDRLRDLIHLLKIPNAPVGRLLLQSAVECGVAVAGIAASVVARAVERELGVFRHYTRRAGKLRLYLAPAYDEQRIGAEHRVEALAMRRSRLVPTVLGSSASPLHSAIAGCLTIRASYRFAHPGHAACKID